MAVASPRCLEINRKCSSRIIYDEPGGASSRSSVSDMLQQRSASAALVPPSTELVPFPSTVPARLAPTEVPPTAAEAEHLSSGCSCFLWCPVRRADKPASSDDPAWVTSTAAAAPPPPQPKRESIETKQGLLEAEAKALGADEQPASAAVTAMSVPSEPASPVERRRLGLPPALDQPG